MDRMHTIWAIRAGIGAGACALLTVWMIPDTTPNARPSVIAGMAATAEAQKPTYSAVPDSAIPSWAANLRQVPAAGPSTAAPPMQVAEAGPPPDMAAAIPPPVAQDSPVSDQPQPAEDPPQAVAEAAPPPSAAAAPAPQDDYQARRAAWQARLDTVMQGQSGPS
jgi:hypothetical protein